MEYLEELLGDSADKHAKALQAMESAHDGYAKEIENLESIHLLDRVAYLENLLGDSAEKHAQAEAALRELKSAHGGHAKEIAVLEDSFEKHASVEDHINYLGVGWSGEQPC